MLKDVLFRLEPYDWKLSSTVLRGASSLVTDLWAGNGPRLLDREDRHPKPCELQMPHSISCWTIPRE
jgi:hypothetical protein